MPIYQEIGNTMLNVFHIKPIILIVITVAALRGADNVFPTPSGAVGIGTTTPNNTLQVVSSSNAGVEIDVTTANPATGVANIILLNANSTVGNATGIDFENCTGAPIAFISAVNVNQNSIGSQSGGLAFSVANSGTWIQPLTIAPSGNIGIGTSSPDNTLTVIGTISAQEIKVTATGADYVFEDGYHLRSLNEVEQYVTHEKHLPEIMTAAEMQKVGMPVSEVVTKQLAKIEELTLYAIEANKRISDGEKRTGDLENSLKAVEFENAELKSRLAHIESLLEKY